MKSYRLSRGNNFISSILFKGSALQSIDSMDQRRYIDPGNYLDLLELLSTFTSELERSKAKLEGLIGQGKRNMDSISNNAKGNLSVLFVDKISVLVFQGNLLMSTKEH